jgi:thymidylate synthase (FAD)
MPMQAELVESFGTDLSAVNAARVSMDKESVWESTDMVGEDENGWYKQISYTLSAKDAKLIDYLAMHKHTSCFEHQGATLRLKVPIFIARQIQRHRTFSYNEISRRYVDSPPEFFWPDTWRKRGENVKQGSGDEVVTDLTTVGQVTPEYVALYGKRQAVDPQKYAETWVGQMLHVYNDMLNSGVAPELARMILPQNMYTEFYMTGNLRNWVHFLKLRLDGHAQKEVQDIAQQVYQILQPLWPVSVEALMKYD